MVADGCIKRAYTEPHVWLTGEITSTPESHQHQLGVIIEVCALCGLSRTKVTS